MAKSLFQSPANLFQFQLQFDVLLHLLATYSQMPSDCGLTAARAHELNALPVADLQQLLASTTTRPIITFHINENNLVNALRALKTRRSEQSLHLEFIQRGASAPMMYQLFRLSRSDVAELRQSLNMVVSNGRPRLPTDSTQIAIFNAWNELSQKIPDQRQRYLSLHDRFPDIPLVSLYAIISTDQ